MNSDKKIDNLIHNIILLQGKTEQRQKMIESEYWKAKTAVQEAGRSLDNTARGIKTFTAETVAEAVNKPLNRFEQRAEELGNRFAALAFEADRQQREAEKRLRMLQWTAFAALAAAAVISIGSAIWAMQAAKQKITRSEWIADINKAVDKGKLTRCADGRGICANIKGKPVRLDK